MTITIYDFDKTVYDGDSMVDFYRYCLSKKPSIIWRLPSQLMHIFLFKLGLENRTTVKSNFFAFLKDVDDVDQVVIDFWKINENKIKQWYRNKDHATDVMISASPEFILQPVTRQLGIQTLIATPLDKHTGQIHGMNCYGSEKVSRLLKEFSNPDVVEAYTDSLSDMPILAMARKKYIVRGNRILDLESYNKLPALQRLFLK